VGLDLKAFLIAQLAYASGILADPCNFADFLRGQNLTDISYKIFSYFISCAHDYFQQTAKAVS
jgi:hypothetical protein